MIRILEAAVYRGPHLYSRTPMVRIQVDLGSQAGRGTDRRPGLVAGLLEALPGLNRHHCSTGHPGGFVERLHEGTLLGHVIEHVALELQVEAGMSASRGKTRAVRGHEGVFNVMFAYEDEQVGRLAGRIAAQLVESLLDNSDRRIEGLDIIAAEPVRDADERVPGLGALRALVARRTLGPTTRSLVEEARRRRIPVQRLDEQSLVLLGQGVNQRSFRASITDATSHLAVLTAGDKQLTKAAARAPPASRCPTARSCRTADEAVAAAVATAASPS